MGSLNEREVQQRTMQFNELLENINVDELLWGKGAGPEVLRWMREHYNPRRMPELVMITRKEDDDGRLWLLGWKHEGTPWRSLLYTIFGDKYGNEMMRLTAANIEMQKWIDKHGLGEYGVPPDRKEWR